MHTPCKSATQHGTAKTLSTCDAFRPHGTHRADAEECSIINKKKDADTLIIFFLLVTLNFSAFA